ncbi:hypothetical protein [Cochleicola gelatinilyticus]|uniref:Curlin n=1 Tax=Cochleicola gelatinilyticus TaxID=1763537 RepID=A0A167HAM7_9FLAO|nr:hypothetical protein [Cochleicola gelatinilyticus]OAB78418.1 hypothetical protein ULVI_10530 [Cochleicola gelatinilyticus]
MKKVILSALALMVGSFVFAQASQDAAAPDVEQADNLSGDAAANRVENTQAGTENYMLVRQEGTSSSVFIDQSGGGAGADEGNLVYVAQAGDVTGNTGLSGQANAADVRQSGTSNEGYVYQGGDRNAAGMQQSGDDQIAYIQQGVLNAEDNYAGVVQSGDTHSSWIFQGHDNNEALSLQSGSGHASKIDQNSAPDGSPGHNARVEQEGTGQMSYVEQDGNNSDADVFQSGDGNYSAINQSGLGTNTADVDQVGVFGQNKSFIVSAGSNQNATVSQINNFGLLGDNISDIIQNGLSENNATVLQDGPSSSENYANIQQTNATTGNATNNATVNQGNRPAFLGSALSGLYSQTNDILDTESLSPLSSSFGNIAFQSQVGAGNRAESHQFNNAFIINNEVNNANTSKQIQTGDNNTALVVQNAFNNLNAIASQNHALQEQTGNNNSVSSIQVGLRNETWMQQNGDDSALAVQSGKENDLVTKQFEGANFMEIGQSGDNGAVYAAQRGGQSFMGDQSGINNVMEILQVGPAGNLLETIDCEIPDPMEPMPIPEMENLMIPDITVPGLCADC